MAYKVKRSLCLQCAEILRAFRSASHYEQARLQTQEALPWLTVAERASAFFEWLRGKGEECEDLAKLLGSCAFETVEPEQSASALSFAGQLLVKLGSVTWCDFIFYNDRPVISY